MEAITVLTAEAVDGEYRALCAEIGQLYIQRSDLAKTLTTLDQAIQEKREALFQIVARHKALAHNEAVEGRRGQ